jgi:hypothetical protein
MFNKHLPKEIILKIIRYLNISDLINVSISRLFLPTLLSTSCYQNTINQYLLHSFITYYILKKNLYITCCISPLILDNNLYFALDIYKLNYLQRSIKSPSYSVNLCCNKLNIFSSILQPFQYYNSLQNKNELQVVLKSIPKCYDICDCHLFHYKKTNDNDIFNTFQRDCCMGEYCLLTI